MACSNICAKVQRSLLALGGCLLLASSPALAESIGVASDVRRMGQRAPADATPPLELASGDPVFLLDGITTNSVGQLRLAMDDDSVLIVGPESELTLDEFVYAGSGDSFTADLAVGGFRFLSGSMPSSSYEIQTPAAVVGLRGTDLIILHDLATNITRVIVLSGVVTVTPACPNGVATAIEVLATTQAIVNQFCSPPTVTSISSLPQWALRTDGLNTAPSIETIEPAAGGFGGGGVGPDPDNNDPNSPSADTGGGFHDERGEDPPEPDPEPEPAPEPEPEPEEEEEEEEEDPSYSL